MPPDASRPVRAYPIALDLDGRECLVVGGGLVAARKVEGLLAAGACVTLVAPVVHPTIVEYETAGRTVRIWYREFIPEDVDGMRLVFACTDSSAVNDQAAAAAQESGILVHRADTTSEGDFTGMSVLEYGSLLIAISTGAESPAFARWVRQRLQAQMGPEFGILLGLAASLREEVKQRLPPADRGAAWERALRSEALDLVRQGLSEEALACLRRRLFPCESSSECASH